jgi:arylsulfatase B/arylsulfatase I/J
LSQNHGDEIRPAVGLNGTYSTRIFSDEAVRHITNHDESEGPLYLYVAPQNVHLACGSKASKLVQGIQAPCETADTFPRVINDTYKGQSAVTQELDMLVGNITAALKAAALWDNTVVIFTSDNGGPLDHTTNYPLKVCV